MFNQRSKTTDIDLSLKVSVVYLAEAVLSRTTHALHPITPQKPVIRLENLTSPGQNKVPIRHQALDQTVLPVKDGLGLVASLPVSRRSFPLTTLSLRQSQRLKARLAEGNQCSVEAVHLHRVYDRLWLSAYESVAMDSEGNLACRFRPGLTQTVHDLPFEPAFLVQAVLDSTQAGSKSLVTQTFSVADWLGLQEPPQGKSTSDLD